MVWCLIETMKKIVLIPIVLLSFLFSQNAFGQKTEKSATEKPAVISCGVCNQQALSLPPPEYPKVALAVNASGTVGVSIKIDEKGNVIEAKAVSGHPLLQPSAIKAALLAKFPPTYISNKPVKVVGFISYKFLPKDSWKSEVEENVEPPQSGKPRFEIKPISTIIGKPINLFKPPFPPNCRCKFSKNLKVIVQFTVDEKGMLSSQKQFQDIPCSDRQVKRQLEHQNFIPLLSHLRQLRHRA